MPKIAVAGFLHETNTFAPQPTRWSDFTQVGDRPGLCVGATILETFRSMNTGIGGAIECLTQRGCTVEPLCWASATPAGHVEEEAFERYVALLLELLEDAGPVDGLYLDLHGAMVVQGFEDGEGELLARIRARVGSELPIVASLDLHANTTPTMFALADALVGYRTYPHLDMRQTGARAGAVLLEMIAKGTKPAKAFRQAPFLIPLTWQCTDIEPNLGIYALLSALEREGLLSATFCAGFPLADIFHGGPSLLSYAWSAALAARAADQLLEAVASSEAAFAGRVFNVDQGVDTAMALAREAARPVLLADTQDNPGVGGTSDTTGLLRALIEHGAQRALVAVIHDGTAARAAHTAGMGATIHLALGGRSGPDGVGPIKADFEVCGLGDGNFTCTGPMWGGTRQSLGPMALLRTGGVDIVVSSVKVQAGDQAIVRHVGAEPTSYGIVALKSSVHFRADFGPLAECVLVVESPGYAVNDPAALAFRKLRSHVKRSPAAPPGDCVASV